MIDAVIVIFTLSVLFLFSIKEVSWNTICQIIVAAVVCILLSFWFIAPVLEQLFSDVFFATSSYVTQDKNDLSKFTVPVLGFLLPARLLSVLFMVLGLPNDQIQIAYLFGLPIFILSIFLLYNEFKWRKEPIYFGMFF